MPTFTLSTNKAEPWSGGGGFGVVYGGAVPFPAQKAECKDTESALSALSDYMTEVMAANLGPVVCSVTLADGQRAPRGWRQLSHRVKTHIPVGF